MNWRGRWRGAWGGGGPAVRQGAGPAFCAAAVALGLLGGALPGVQAGGVAVRNVTWSAVGTVPGGRDVRFDLSWENSWRRSDGPANWDAVWLFAKYRTGTGAGWRPVVFSTAPDHCAVNGPGDVPAVLSPAADGTGVFAYRARDGSGPINWTGVALRWLTAGVPGPNEAQLAVRVFALEMVYVPGGEFYVGDGVSPGRLHAGGKPALPARITAAVPSLRNSPGGLWAERITPPAVGGMSRLPTWDQARTPISAGFPTGFRAFYIMKYEVTQGQYAEFLSTLTQPQAAARAPTPDDTRSPRPQSRRRVAAGRTPEPPRYGIARLADGRYTAAAPENACNYLGLADALAFADWAALRPMTETEFEKACRGRNRTPVPGEYAWGSTRLVSMFDFQGIDGSGTETALPGDANTLCGQTMTGPVRVGIHENRPTRELAGASYYGVLDLSGNVAERTVTLGTPEGRSYTGNHGDGELTTDGEADVAQWPAGVTAGATEARRRSRSGRNGFGWRGGDWLGAAVELRVSTRNSATYATPRRHPAAGFRGVRSAAVR